MNRLALALLVIAALVGVIESVGNETFGRESRQSDIFGPALGISKPSSTKRRPGGSIKYKKISVKTASTAPAPEVVPIPESTTLKPNKTRKLKPKSSNRHTMIYKPNKKATATNLEEESTTTTTTEASTTTLRSTTKPIKTYTTTTTQKPADEPGDPFVRPTKRVRLRVTKPPAGESGPTATAGSREGEKRPPAVDPLRPIVRARISTTTPVPTTKFTRRPTKEATKSSSTEFYDFRNDDESNYEPQREEYQQRMPEKEPLSTVHKVREPSRPPKDKPYYEEEPERPAIQSRLPEKESQPTVYKVTEPPPRSTSRPYYEAEPERPTIRTRLPEVADELYTRPPSFGYGVRLASKTSAETESSGLRHEEAGKNPGQQFKVSGEYIKIQAKPEPPPERERPEEKKTYFKPQPHYEQEERIPDRDHVPTQYRPYDKKPAEYYERDEAFTSRYTDYPSSSPTYPEDLAYRKRYPIPPVTYEPPHIEYSPPSPPPPSRIYRPPTEDYNPPSAYYPRPAEIEDLYKYPSYKERPSGFQNEKQPSYRLVGTDGPDHRQPHYRPRQQEPETNIYRRPIEYPQRDEIKNYRGQVGEEINVYRRPLDPPQEPERNQYDQRDETKHYRGQVAEVDAVRGLAPTFETFTRLVAVGQPTSSDLPYPPSLSERPKNQANSFERRPNPQVHAGPEKSVRYEQLRDDLKILETVLVGSPVTSAPRPEARPISRATERPRFPGESNFRVLESAVINRGHGGSPSTKLRPPSEPEASYIPIPLNGQGKWQQTNPTREFSDEKIVHQRGSPSPVKQPFQPVSPSNSRPFTNYAPLDSPFTRPSTAQRFHEGRNGRLIPSFDTITDNPETISIKPTQRPFEYLESETSKVKEISYRRPKELFSYQQVTPTQPEYPYEATFKPREPFTEQKPDNMKKEFPRFEDSYSTAFVERKPEFASNENKYNNPFSEFFEQQGHVPKNSYYDPLPEAYATEKQKYLQGEHYQAKEPFPEAFVDQKPEYLQTVIYQPEDHLPEDTPAVTAKTPEREVTPQQEGAAVKGVPGVDYPVYTSIPPNLSFKCEYVESTGYYADLETRCQVFHVCQPNNVKSSFLCPNGTIFNQKVRVCDWWHNVQCGDAPSYYHINSETEQEREVGNSY